MRQFLTLSGLALASFALVVTFRNCGQSPDAYQSSVSSLQQSQVPSPDPSATPDPASTPAPSPAPMPAPQPPVVNLLNYDCVEVANSTLRCLGPVASHIVAEQSVAAKYKINVDLSCSFVVENRGANLVCSKAPYPFAMKFANMDPIYPQLKIQDKTPNGSRCSLNQTSFNGSVAPMRGFNVICQSLGVDLNAELAYLNAKYANMKGGPYSDSVFADLSLTCQIGTAALSNGLYVPPGWNYIVCSGTAVGTRVMN